MPFDRFGYEILDEGLREFRLLTIHPRSARGETFHISITTHQLSASPPYEALSYVWGAFIPNDPYYILIGEKEEEGLEVSPNLFYILCELSLRETDLVMWIDAICIDQDDLDERSSQVQLMRDIYERATKTIVFLGDETVGTSWILPLLEEITWSQEWTLSGESQAVIEAETKFKQRLASTNQIKGILSNGLYDDIALRPFWTRIWIVQEVVLSKNTTIMIGAHEVSWDWFADRIGILNSIALEIFTAISTEPSGLANLDTIQNIRGLRKLGYQPTLCDMLACLRMAKSTDPRDMIYGLLGLVTTSILVDYNASTPQTVYVDVVQHSISMEKSLDIITMRKAPSSLIGLPSWAPDWSAAGDCDFSQEGDLIDGTNRVPVPLVLRYVQGASLRDCLRLDEAIGNDDNGVKNIKPFNASAGRALFGNEVVIDRHTMELHATGISLGSINDVGMVLDREMTRGEIFFHDTFQDWENIFLRQYGNCEIGILGIPHTVHDVLSRVYFLLMTHLTEIGEDYSSETWKLEEFEKRQGHCTENGRQMQMTKIFRESRPVEAFLRTIFADADIEYQRISPEHFEEFWANPLPKTSSWPRRVYSLIPTTYRRFFITYDGSMGLAPMRARKNDIVCVLYGCSVPVVLREEEKGRFSFIGECFVHGFMDGEAIDMLKTGDLGEHKWEIY